MFYVKFWLRTCHNEIVTLTWRSRNESLPFCEMNGARSANFSLRRRVGIARNGRDTKLIFPIFLRRAERVRGVSGKDGYTKAKRVVVVRRAYKIHKSTSWKYRKRRSVSFGKFLSLLSFRVFRTINVFLLRGLNVTRNTQTVR